MSACLLPEVLVLRGDTAQTELPLAAEGVLRYVWEHRFGSMLVEVKGGRAFVNGRVIEPAIHVDGQPGNQMPPHGLPAGHRRL